MPAITIYYNMNRNHLALFRAVAKAGSISGGALLARVSQPAVSKQIAELEGSLELRLLDRLPRGCKLTEAGTILEDYADRLLAIEKDAVRALQEYRGLKRGRLSIGASLTIGAYLLPGIIAEFHRLFPEIELDLKMGNSDEIQKLLLAGTIEIGMTEGLIESEGLDSSIFFEDDLVVIAPKGHPLLKKKQVTLHEISGEPFIFREAGSGIREYIEKALGRHMNKINIVLSLASPAAIKNFVASGMGIAIVPRMATSLEVKAGLLGVIAMKDLQIRRPLQLHRIRDRNQSPSLIRFLDVLNTSLS